MKAFTHLGFNNWIQTKLIAVIQVPGSAPATRFVQEARERNVLSDVTQGRKTKTILTLVSGQIVLSALTPDTIIGRVENSTKLGNGKPIEEETK